MTFTPAHKPGGAPDGGQFTAPAHSDAVPALSAADAAKNTEFWEKAQADSVARQERIRRHEADRAARSGQATAQEPVEYVPETVPPVRKGFFSRAFAALESFGTSVDERHQREMDAIDSLSRQARISRESTKAED